MDVCVILHRIFFPGFSPVLVMVAQGSFPVIALEIYLAVGAKLRRSSLSLGHVCFRGTSSGYQSIPSPTLPVHLPVEFHPPTFQEGDSCCYTDVTKQSTIRQIFPRSHSPDLTELPSLPSVLHTTVEALRQASLSITAKVSFMLALLRSPSLQNRISL